MSSNTSKAQLIAAFDQFRLEIARAAQYAALLDDETNHKFSLADDLVRIGIKIGEASEYVTRRTEETTQGA